MTEPFAAALPPGRGLTHLPETGSTNADLRAAATAGDALPGHVVVADHQSAGRGRLDRTWESPAGAGLLFSVLVDPGEVTLDRWGWLPLLAGLAVAEGARAATGVELRVKWPNDVLHDGRKVAGVLCERVDVGTDKLVIVGVGLNVSTAAADLPVPHATSLALAGAGNLDRPAILAAILERLDARVGAWRAAAGDAAEAGLADLYLVASATLGRDVSIVVPGDETVDGHALRVDPSGALVVRTVDGERTVSVGDLAF
ncbi:MAG: biotin--[acetyl-CoA-carboxylase] ligase [Sporichthyaceae bacterium]